MISLLSKILAYTRDVYSQEDYAFMTNTWRSIFQEFSHPILLKLYRLNRYIQNIYLELMTFGVFSLFSFFLRQTLI